MASPFDDAWADSDSALAHEMGEAITLGDVTLQGAVVSPVVSGRRGPGPVANSGVQFTVNLSLAQVQQFFPDGTTSLAGKKVSTQKLRGRILSVTDLGGAGVELQCGPATGMAG